MTCSMLPQMIRRIRFATGLTITKFMQNTFGLVLRHLIFAFCLLVLGLTNSGNAAELSGEQKIWHKTTLTFDGPNVSETGEDNPFSDYRL